MDVHKNKISSNKSVIIILLVFATMSFALSLSGYRGRPPIPTNPAFLGMLAVLALCFELRTVTFSSDMISIHYHLLFVKRNILWKRVQHIEFVYQERVRYLLISLDNCPSFYESKRKIKDYIFLHPIKLIVVSIPDNKKVQCIDMIQKYYSDITFVENDFQ